MNRLRGDLRMHGQDEGPWPRIGKDDTLTSVMTAGAADARFGAPPRPAMRQGLAADLNAGRVPVQSILWTAAEPAVGALAGCDDAQAPES